MLIVSLTGTQGSLARRAVSEGAGRRVKGSLAGCGAKPCESTITGQELPSKRTAIDEKTQNKNLPNSPGTYSQRTQSRNMKQGSGNREEGSVTKRTANNT